MYSASIAEWIVGRSTSAKRAASIVGDLLELKPQKGPVWFWFSIAGVVLALAWRRPLAFIAALYAGSWALGGFQMAIWGIHAQHRPPESWIPAFGMLGGFGTILALVLTYSSIRYGLRDQLTQLAFASMGLVTAVIYLWWQPAILAVCLALSICLSAISISNKERRRTALALLVQVSVGFGGGMLATYLEARFQRFIYPGQVGTRELQEHPSLQWLGFGAYFMTVWLITTACSRTHDWLMCHARLDSETEERQAL
jgi:hypothetical protein